MTETIRYNLSDFQNIISNGFNFELPSDTIHMISELALQVGSPTYIKTPIFQKKNNIIQNNNDYKDINKKKKTKNSEQINDDNWVSIRTFQTTKIEQKVGIDAQIDLIRLHINKLTDKNYIDIRNKIVEIIDKILNDNNDNDDINKVSNIIFDIATNNRFYSKNYADLYSDLINNYSSMKKVFEDNFNQFINYFDNIEYIDPSIDYDKFCKINKENEKRKSLSAFFVNLMKNNIISRDKIAKLIENLLNQLLKYIQEENKKNEVDEITENISILYCYELFHDDNSNIDENNFNISINGLNITDTIHKLAHSKLKDYKSLTNKSIFKYMDMIDL
jgi:hypothetical protein